MGVQGCLKQASGARPHSAGPWHQPPKETEVNLLQVQSQPGGIAAQTPLCICGEEQTMEHIIEVYPLQRLKGELFTPIQQIRG